MKTRLLAFSLLTFGLAFSALPASAGFLAGAFTISGDYAPTGGAGLADATGLDFIDDDFEVDASTLDFAATGISRFDAGTINDFAFATAVGQGPLWTIDGFSFSLRTFRIIFQNSFALILSGSGIVSGNGYDDTVGYWNLTANANGNIYNFSSGVTVPEPATALLIGLGLVGFGVSRRKR